MRNQQQAKRSSLATVTLNNLEGGELRSSVREHMVRFCNISPTNQGKKVTLGKVPSSACRDALQDAAKISFAIDGFIVALPGASLRDRKKLTQPLDDVPAACRKALAEYQAWHGNATADTGLTATLRRFLMRPELRMFAALTPEQLEALVRQDVETHRALITTTLHLPPGRDELPKLPATPEDIISPASSIPTKPIPGVDTAPPPPDTGSQASTVIVAPNMSSTSELDSVVPDSAIVSSASGPTQGTAHPELTIHPTNGTECDGQTERTATLDDDAASKPPVDEQRGSSGATLCDGVVKEPPYFVPAPGTGELEDFGAGSGFSVAELQPYVVAPYLRSDHHRAQRENLAFAPQGASKYAHLFAGFSDWMLVDLVDDDGELREAKAEDCKRHLPAERGVYEWGAYSPAREGQARRIVPFYLGTAGSFMTSCFGDDSVTTIRAELDKYMDVENGQVMPEAGKQNSTLQREIARLGSVLVAEDASAASKRKQTQGAQALFDEFQARGFQMVVRWCVCETPLEPEWLERWMLTQVDYAANLVNNGPRRSDPQELVVFESPTVKLAGFARTPQGMASLMSE